MNQLTALLEARIRAAGTTGYAPIALLLGAHFLFLVYFFEPAISTPDANGYFAQARLIADESRTDIVVESPAQYVGDHWMQVGDGRYYGQYPPGLPALLALVYRPLGPSASLWVLPLMGTLSLLALFLVVRDWLGPGWGLLAAALMAVNPFANAHALGADSHTAVCFFLMWGLWGFVRWERTRSAWWAALAGFCLGMIPSIRYAEALFPVAVAVFAARSWRREEGVRALLAGVECGALPMLALAWRNQAAFGAFWKTGYSISGEQTSFGPGYFLRHFLPYLFLIATIGAFAVFFVGVRGIFVLCRRSDADTRRRGQLLVALTLPITLLYMSYYWPPDPKSMRFLLPTFFLYTIAAVHLLQVRAATDPTRGRRQAKLLLMLTLIWGLPLSVFELRHLKQDNAALARVERGLKKYVDPGSILIAQSGLQQHLDFVGGWKLAPEEAFDRRARPPRPPGPHMFRDDGPPPIEERSPVERSRGLRAEVARWADGRRKIYWLTSEARLKAVSDRLANADEWVRVAEITVPGPPHPPPFPPEFRDGPGPGGPPRWRRWFGRGGPPSPPPPEFDESPEPPPPGPPPHPDRRGRPPGPPARFHPPADGKFLLVEWRVAKH